MESDGIKAKPFFIQNVPLNNYYPEEDSDVDTSSHGKKFNNFNHYSVEKTI